MIQLALFFFTFVISDVLKVNEDNFKSTLNKNEFVFIKFFAPWCGHCKSLAPHFLKLSKSASEYGVVLGEVDCTEDVDLCNEQGVKGYPTLVLFKNGKPITYSGERGEPEMLQFLKKKAGNSLALVDSIESLKEKISDSFIIGYFPDLESESFQQFKTSSLAESASFYYVTDASVLQHLTDSSSSVLFYRKMDNKTISYTDEKITSEAISEFINKNILPGVIWLSRENAGNLFIQDSKVLLVMVNLTTGEVPQLEDQLLKAFELVNGKVKTCIVDVSKPEFDAIVDFFGFTEFPAFGGIHITDSFLRYHPEDSTLSQENLNDFISKLATGEAKRFVKKEPVPEDWNELPVKVVTYGNFDNVVLDETKNVFIMIYAPWCTHCKNLKPVWEQLAMHYEENTQVLIAKTDATKNEYDIDIEGFPTLFFYPKGPKTQKSYVKYEGKRNLKDLISFIDSKIPSAEPDSDGSEEL